MGEKYNFIQFKSKYEYGGRAYKGGMSIGKTIGYLSETQIPQDLDYIDIFIDKEKNALKIIKGNTFKLSKNIRKNGKSSYSFSSKSLITEGIKTGHYKYIGNNIFILEIL